MKQNRLMIRVYTLIGVVILCFSCQSVNIISSTDDYSLFGALNNQASPLLGGGLQIKDIDFKVNLPKGWKKSDGSGSLQNCLLYEDGEALFLRTNSYTKYTRGDTVEYYVTNRPTGEDFRDNEVLYDKNYIREKDTCFIPNEDQLWDLLPLFTGDPLIIDEYAKKKLFRKSLYYRKGFADFLLINIKPKNFDRFFYVITSYEELDQPDGW